VTVWNITSAMSRNFERWQNISLISELRSFL